jgi:hypothetical protein
MLVCACQHPARVGRSANYLVQVKGPRVYERPCEYAIRLIHKRPSRAGCRVFMRHWLSICQLDVCRDSRVYWLYLVLSESRLCPIIRLVLLSFQTTRRYASPECLTLTAQTRASRAAQLSAQHIGHIQRRRLACSLVGGRWSASSSLPGPLSPLFHRYRRMIVLLVQGQAALPALIKPLPCDDLHVPTDRVFVLLSRWRGRNQVRYGLGQVAVVFRAVLLDGILDVFSLLGCPLSTVQSLLAETCIRTIIKSRQADLQAVEGGQAVLLFECFHIHIAPLHPFCAHGLQPSREQHTNVLAALCDIAVLVAARIPNDEMRYVRG